MTLVLLREITTVVIAVAITAVALSLLIWAFFRISEPAISADQVKNAPLLEAQTQARETVFHNRLLIVNLGIGLLGVVTGYFFGRVPSERRAERAEQTAEQSVAAAETQAQVAVTANEEKGKAEQGQEVATRELAGVKQDVLATIAAAKQQLAPAVTAGKTLSAGGVAPAEAGNLIVARAELDALERRLGA